MFRTFSLMAQDGKRQGFLRRDQWQPLALKSGTSGKPSMHFVAQVDSILAGERGKALGGGGSPLHCPQMKREFCSVRPGSAEMRPLPPSKQGRAGLQRWPSPTSSPHTSWWPSRVTWGTGGGACAASSPAQLFWHQRLGPRKVSGAPGPRGSAAKGRHAYGALGSCGPTGCPRPVRDSASRTCVRGERWGRLEKGGQDPGADWCCHNPLCRSLPSPPKLSLPPRPPAPAAALGQ